MVSAQSCRCSTGLINYVPKEDHKPLSETGKIERHRNYHLHVLNLIPADIINNLLGLCWLMYVVLKYLLIDYIIM